MRLRPLPSILFFWAGALVWACSLNPQPLPPGEADEDASADGASFSADGSGDGDAFASEPDADAGQEDAASDASMDAADALEAE